MQTSSSVSCNSFKCEYMLLWKLSSIDLLAGNGNVEQVSEELHLSSVQTNAASLIPWIGKSPAWNKRIWSGRSLEGQRLILWRPLPIQWTYKIPSSHMRLAWRRCEPYCLCTSSWVLKRGVNGDIPTKVSPIDQKSRHRGNKEAFNHAQGLMDRMGLKLLSL